MKAPTTVFVYTHTHWDREWYRTFQQYRLKLIEIIDIILDQLDKNELEYFTLDGQAIVIEDYLAVKPQNKDKLISYISEGRLDIGPWLVLPDEFLVNGESLVENLRLGHKLSNKYGKTNKVGYIPDSFGHSIDIPAILNKFNIDNSIIWRGVNTNKSEFKWYSMDKSNVKAFHLVKGYYTEIFEEENNFTLEEKAEKLIEFLKEIKEKTTHDFLIMPIGGDHRPPPPNLKTQLEKINSIQSDYKFIQTGLTTILKRINPDLIEEHVQQELRDCTKSYILPAVYSSRLYLKQQNAILTNKITSYVEPLTCFCNSLNLDTFKFPDSEYLWKLLILNHPHDSICGCSIDPVHTEMEQRYTELHQACDELINRAKLSIMKHIPENEIAVYNSSNYTYTGPVKITSTNTIPELITTQHIDDFEDRHFKHHQDITVGLPATIIEKQSNNLIWVNNIPAHSCKIINESTINNEVTVNNGILTNGLIEIHINQSSITLKDIVNNEEYKNINQLVDRLDCGDTYNFGPVKGYKPIKAKIINSQITQIGPIKGTIELTYKLTIPEKIEPETNTPSKEVIDHYIKCNVNISANSKLVEFELNWENKSEDHILQVQFPVENDIYSTLVENHFCTIERRFDPSYNIYEHVPAKPLTELKTNTAPMQRFVQFNEIALFNEGLPEYEVFQNNLYLTVLRATGYLSKANTQTRAAYAGPELATPDNQCLRVNTARYAIHPKTSIPELYKIAEEFIGCTTAMESNNKYVPSHDIENKLIKWINPAIIATRYKYDDNSNSILVHLLNVSNFKQEIEMTSTKEINYIKETNFLNEEIKDITKDKYVSFNPYEIKSIQINLI
ncbi:MAG: glycoside hydrolase family 38 C-terminal domain-containing protein [Vampirovibrionia bacterium]